MPHCTIEYSSSLLSAADEPALLRDIHDAVANSGLFAEGNIKTRSRAISIVLVGGEPSRFVHVAVRILEGRTTEQKKELSNAVHQALTHRFKNVQALSVEVIDMERDSYTK